MLLMNPNLADNSKSGASTGLWHSIIYHASDYKSNLSIEIEEKKTTPMKNKFKSRINSIIIITVVYSQLIWIY